MTTTAAVLIALIAGAAVAWFLYLFKQNAKTPWVLAFLRFTWFSLLVYALLSPSTSTQSTLKLAEPLTILLDSSASLIESYTKGLSDLETSLKAEIFPTKPETIPLSIYRRANNGYMWEMVTLRLSIRAISPWPRFYSRV